MTLKNRASDDEWVRREYERLMGKEALYRQERQKQVKQKTAEELAQCDCGWKIGMGKAEKPGPHHAPTCPKFAVEEAW